MSETEGSWSGWNAEKRAHMCWEAGRRQGPDHAVLVDLAGKFGLIQEQWVTMGMFEPEGTHDHIILLEGNSQYRITKVRKVN